MTELNSRLERRKINDLLNNHFDVPAYQRGYRWTETQVRQLILDIIAFKQNTLNFSPQKIELPFYCLQPIVVKKYTKDNKIVLEVIDGQQRLTSILLILHYLNQTEFKKAKDIYRIDYATRGSSKDFLNFIENSDFPEKNIDYFHLFQAYTTIDNTFSNLEKHNSAIKGDFYSVLINHVQVIWYELDDNSTDDSNSIDIFTRLNVGKIPLTNAELIKALFLQKTNFLENKTTEKQLQIASEWDFIEKTLQNDAFWYFIYNPDNPIKYESRIEYIFDLMKNRDIDDEYYYTFNLFSTDLIHSREEKGYYDIATIWLAIKRYFLTFEEWFNDRELYHYIGFLVDCGRNLNHLKQKTIDCSKNEFRDYLKREIKKEVETDIEKLTYKDSKTKKVLLLFNIETILKTDKTDIKFPFYRYKKEKWDIEHVCSQVEKTPNSLKAMTDWAWDIFEYFTGKEKFDTDSNLLLEEEVSFDDKDIDSIYKELTRFLSSGSEELFQSLYSKVQKYFKEDVENKDSIANLALLDANTNRSYKNAMFPIKRKVIITNDMQGVFIPICTKNLFLKLYSKQMAQVMYWTTEDADDYLGAMQYTLKEYLSSN